MGMWDQSHLPYYVFESVFFGKHIEQIGSVTDHILNPPWVQVMRKSYSIIVTVSLHLEYKLTDVAEAEATVPTCIRQ